MQTTRRDAIKGLMSLPILGAFSAKTTGSAIGQPEPITAMAIDLDGVTAITRSWTEADARRCPRCRTCYAQPTGRGLAVCTILTEEKVPDRDVATYDTRHLDLGDA